MPNKIKTEIIEIKDGKIYSSTVTGITRSDIGKPCEKNARYDSSNIFGKVKENTTNAILISNQHNTNNDN